MTRTLWRTIVRGMIGPLVLLLGLSGPTLAQSVCGDQGQTLWTLDKHFGEAMMAQGVGASGWLVQLWVSKDGATWSLVALSPDGQSACLLATGEGWQQGRPS